MIVVSSFSFYIPLDFITCSTDVGAGPSYEEEVDIGGVGLSAGVSSDQLQQLKLDANACVNDTLLKKVQEIEQVTIMPILVTTLYV